MHIDNDAPNLYFFLFWWKNPFLESRDDYVTVDDFELSQKHIQLKQDRFFNRIKKEFKYGLGHRYELPIQLVVSQLFH